MITKYKIEELQLIIKTKLTPLIDSDYVYWDLPYHKNIGDTLIWQGTLDFLSKEVSYEMLNSGSSYSVSFSNLKENVVICLNGGGNFGDIYKSSREFRNNVISRYVNNKIIIFPQSIHYNDNQCLEDDKQIINAHKNICICVRDQKSYFFAKEHFYNSKVLLVPDMAFYIKNKRLAKAKKRKSNGTLFLKRKDGELDLDLMNKIKITDEMFISDWPTFEKESLLTLGMRFFNGSIRRLNQKNMDARILKNISDVYAKYLYKPYLIKSGLKFLSKFETIYTTRLHVCILGVLLEKNVFLIDNCYGKNAGFYNAWLKEVDNVKKTQ